MALKRKLTTKIYEIQAHDGYNVTSLDIGATGRVLVTGGQDRNVNLWALGNEKCFMSLSDHNGQVDCVRFASGDDIVYSADENGIIKRWDLNEQSGCVSFYGHMKSVRTLDFHPNINCIFASGSNDTTVRLWDLRKGDGSVAKYRGHIANVNSVKFSPDGWWIASAGTEGSVIIWDVRTTNKVMEFQEHASPVTCITFHPFDFLLAAGRNDGTVDLYDLETQKLISRTANNSPFNGHTVKCITFGENGECCFVGCAEGISVIGWEPDREFDHIESAWSMLGDMKIVKNRLICGSYEKQSVLVHAVNLDHVIPYYNPTNIPFSYNQSTRKSFNRGTPKMKLALKSHNAGNNNSHDHRSGSLTSGKVSTPSSLSFEMIEEGIDEPPSSSKHAYVFENIARSRGSYLDVLSLPNENYNQSEEDYPNPNIHTDVIYFDDSSNDLDFYPEKMVEPEREDFPINSAQQPDYAPKYESMQNTMKPSMKTKTFATQRKTIHQQSNFKSSLSNSKKFSSSNIDLHSIDDSIGTFGTNKKGTSSRNGSPTRNYTNFNNSINKFKRPEIPKETIHARNNRKIPVQIHVKHPPPLNRAKTTLDLRANSAMSSLSMSNTSSSLINSTIPAMQSQSKGFASSSYHNNNNNNNGHGAGSAEENAEISVLTAYHERVYQQLSTRYATLQLVRNSTRSHDITGALRHIIKMQDHSVIVDLLGAILEKPASWNLDMCTLLLPEIYELLQSEHKFHFTRACDTLRIILSNFLPIIQEHSGPWAQSYGGVDISREERARKCLECAHWLCKIKVLPDNRHMGSNLTQLQNLIVDV